MYNSQYYTCEQIDERLLQGYLDDYNNQTGQSLTKEQFLTKLGNIFSKETVIDNTAVNIGYFVCDTTADIAAKVLTAAGYELFHGGSIKVKFINRNTVGSVTLNINSKGAKALYYGGKPVSASNSWDNNEVVEIYYDGTSYYANNVEGNFKDGIFDISAYNLTEGQPTKYATLAEALGTDGNNVPPIFRKSGMQVKYVTLDNKYVQYRYMGTETTGNPFLNEVNWHIDFTRIFERTAVEVSISPNILNRWGNIESLTISSFQGAQVGLVNEYMLEFTVDGDDFNLTLPEGVRWVDEPTWENDYTYQVSIVDNLAVCAGWEAPEEDEQL